MVQYSPVTRAFSRIQPPGVLLLRASRRAQLGAARRRPRGRTWAAAVRLVPVIPADQPAASTRQNFTAPVQGQLGGRPSPAENRTSEDGVQVTQPRFAGPEQPRDPQASARDGSPLAWAAIRPSHRSPLPVTSAGRLRGSPAGTKVPEDADTATTAAHRVSQAASPLREALPGRHCGGNPPAQQKDTGYAASTIN